MEKYTVQDYYNYMKFNPDDENMPQEFLDEYISDVTNTDWFITHVEMINDFLDNMRMNKLAIFSISSESYGFISYIESHGMEGNLFNIFNYEKLSPDQITTAISKGDSLYILYQSPQELTNEHIYKAIDKGKDLYTLFRYKNLTPEQIEYAIKKGKDLEYLHKYQKTATVTAQEIANDLKEEKKMTSLLKLAKQEDIAFDATAHIRVWADITDLEYEKEVEDIKKMGVSLEEKIKLGKEFAKSIAMKNLYERILDIRELGELQETYDRIDWVSLFETEE